MSKAKRQRKHKAARKRQLREERYEASLDKMCFAMMEILTKELGLKGDWQELSREDARP